MKVLHTITGLQIGGAETVLYRLLSVIAQNETDTHRVVCLGPSGPIAEKISQTGIRVYHLHGTGRLSAPKLALQLRQIATKFSPDLCVGWMYDGNLAAWWAQRHSKSRVIWNIRHSISDLSRERKSARIVIRLNALLSRSADLIIYNSQFAIQQHARLGFNNSGAIAIPNGVDTNKFFPDAAARKRWRETLGIGKHEFVIGHVARIHPMKGHAILLQAIHKARKTIPNMKVVLVGRDANKNNHLLRQAIVENDVGDSIICLGEQSEVGPLNSMFDVAVSPSEWGEGFSNTIAEAMSCALPVIATDVGDSTVLIGNAGLIIPPSNSTDLAEALCEIYNKPLAARSVMGMNARERIVARFELKRMATTFQDVMTRIGGRLDRSNH